MFPLNTVQLAHHPGYGAWRGHKLRPEQLDEILGGLEARGVLARCAAVLSGYLGDPGVADVVARAVAAVRAARPGAPYCCDPVIGDDEPGVFVSAGVARGDRASAWSRLPMSSCPTASSSRTSRDCGSSRWRTRSPPRQSCAPAARAW